MARNSSNLPYALIELLITSLKMFQQTKTNWERKPKAGI
jgi:hypothetical protein